MFTGFRHAIIRFLLNEVLSLNAQESVPLIPRMLSGNFLNEVLSLNAQEFDRSCLALRFFSLLNEVLSLNAQE